MGRLSAALDQGLDDGLTVNEIKEVLVQLYAYAGFPRSLNALAEFMKVLEARRQRGVADAQGRAPGPLPPPEQMLAVGTANQTRLTGAPVKGPLFEFAPAVDQYLKARLFGDIFIWSPRRATSALSMPRRLKACAVYTCWMAACGPCWTLGQLAEVLDQQLRTAEHRAEPPSAHSPVSAHQSAVEEGALAATCRENTA